VALSPLDVRDEAHTAGVVLVGGIVETLGLRQTWTVHGDLQNGHPAGPGGVMLRCVSAFGRLLKTRGETR
jgi:hypothetical protein